jgi:poly(3-hydroxybutyrate) depolymerase
VPGRANADDTGFITALNATQVIWQFFAAHHRIRT